MKTTVGHAKHDDCDVYIGRKDEGRKTIQNTAPGDCFGNPYRIENHSRGASVRKFADLLDTLLEERPIYRLYVRDLAGKTIGCWCRRVSESEPVCHGDILSARADHLHEQMVSGGGQPCERGDHCLVNYRQWRECVWCGISSQSLAGKRAIDRTGAYLWPRDGDEPHHVSDVSFDNDNPNNSYNLNNLNNPENPSNPNNSRSPHNSDEPTAGKQDRGISTPDERARNGGAR